MNTSKARDYAYAARDAACLRHLRGMLLRGASADDMTRLILLVRSKDPFQVLSDAELQKDAEALGFSLHTAKKHFKNPFSTVVDFVKEEAQKVEDALFPPPPPPHPQKEEDKLSRVSAILSDASKTEDQKMSRIRQILLS